MEQAVGAGRGQQWTASAQLAQAIDTTKVAQNAHQSAAFGRDGRVTLSQNPAKHSKSNRAEIEPVKKIGPEPGLRGHIRIAIRR